MKKLYRFASLMACISGLGFYTAQAQTYCTAQWSTGCGVGDQIENFSTTGGITNITNNNSGCNSASYTYYSNMTLQVNLGQTFGVSVQAGSQWQQGHGIWIDWNNDKDWDDPGEFVWNSGTYGYQAFTGNITVPMTALPGQQLRMRVRCNYFSLPSSPCAQQSYGEAEDYNVFIVPPVGNDAGISAITSPAPYSCTLSDSIKVKLVNSGNLALTSANINWNINGGTTSSTSWTGNIPAYGTSNPVFLGTASMNDGNVLRVWTDSPNSVQDSFPINDTLETTLYEAISGTFTVGGTSPDYTTLDSAFADLYFRGLCGPVVLQMRAGTYTGQVVVGEIQGASMTNTVTIEPETGAVTIEATPNSSDNYVIKLDGSDHIIFNDLIIQVSSNATTYSTVIDMNGGATYNEFNNCQINGYANATTSTYQRVIYCQSSDNNYNKFMNNEITGGSYSVYFWGSSTSAPNIGNEWIGNSFLDSYYYGTYFYYGKEIKFKHNTLKSSTPYYYGYGFMCYYHDGASEIVGNNLSWPGYSALYCYQLNGNANSKPLVANNMVHSGSGQYYVYGAYVYGGFIQFVYNTIVKHSSPSYGYYGIYCAGGGNTVMNNIFYDPQGSSTYYTMYYGGGFAVLESDYNDVFTKQNFGYFNGVITSLAQWQTSTGFDMHSLTTDPGFTNYDSLRTCNDTLDGAGTPLSYVLDDFDGDDRDGMTPDIGADEFVGADSGAYSAGPDAIVCDGKSVVIGQKVTGGSFLWSTSETTSTIEVTQAGTYQVTMTTSCGATHIDEVVVEDVTPTATFTVQDNFHTGIFTNTGMNGTSWRWVVQTSPFDTVWTKDLVYVFPDNGPYQVCLTTYNDCDTVESCGLWEGYVGLEENSLANVITLMPNPVSDELTIQFNGLESDQINVEVTNVQGQVIYTEKYVNVSGNATKRVDVSNLKSGLYIVKFTTENDVTAKRVIVQ
jgi:hypothetical protein